jgi:hypothetical protein
MKVLATVAIALGVMTGLGRGSADAGGPARTGPDAKKAAREKAPAVTVWVLRYERRDGSPLADDRVLPKFIDPALAKLREKGAKRMAFNFKQRELYLWFEGNRDVTLEDIRPAFSILELKVVAKAAFPQDP